MKKGLDALRVLWLFAVLGLLLHPALCFGTGQPAPLNAASPLFVASLERGLSDLSSSRIALDGEVYDPDPTVSTENGRDSASQGVIRLADADLPPIGRPFPTLSVTCAGSGGATCRGTATCAGSETCYGSITCGTTCAGSGGATCGGTATCGEHTCSGRRICREMSPYR